jgi:hypothetical protein
MGWRGLRAQNGSVFCGYDPAEGFTVMIFTEPSPISLNHTSPAPIISPFALPKRQRADCFRIVWRTCSSKMLS